MIYPLKCSPLRRLVTLLLLVLGLAYCKEKIDPVIIITDDVIMLVTPATGLESAACTNFPAIRALQVPPIDSQEVFWTEGKSLFNDTLRVIRLEMVHDTGTVAQFTMTLRPKTDAPSEVQCMKGFGCDGPWVNFPWKSPNGNFLDHTVFKFRVQFRGKSRFVVENYNTNESLTVRVNPQI